MKPELIIELAILIVVIAQCIITFIFFRKSGRGSAAELSGKLLDYDKRLDRNEASLREEFGRNRDETGRSAREAREELSASLKSNRDELNKTIVAFEEKISAGIASFSEILDRELKSVQDRVIHSTKENREEMAVSLKSFEEKSSARIEALTRDTKEGLDRNRDTVEKKLAEIQKENGEKLEQMRQTVDEKLHQTLEKRLNESFQLVSTQLESVQKGLGEMQSLASGVGDLKKVLTNVKTRGNLGEIQLGAILEQVLSNEQFEKNVIIKENSSERVEYVIKLPNKNDRDELLLLPVDSKFPNEDYQRLMDAYDGMAICPPKSWMQYRNSLKIP